MTRGLPHTYRSVTRRTDGALVAARTAVRIDPWTDYLEQFETAVARNHGPTERPEPDRPATAAGPATESQSQLERWSA